MNNYCGKKVENLECIEDLGYLGKNRMLMVRCNKCGEVFRTRSYLFSQNKHKCKKSYVGMSNGVLMCIEDLGDYRNDDRHLVKVRCSRCGRISIVRSDRLTAPSYIPKSCTYCKDNLHKEIADSKYKESRHFRKRYSSIIGNAKGRKIPFNLSEEQVSNLLQQNCYYCGEPIADGIDRIDSSKGYNIDNVVPCCGICNRMKNKYPLNIFLDKITKIHNNLVIKSSTTIEST